MPEPRTTEKKTALLLGATGLVGGEVLQRLEDSEDWGRILAPGRRPPAAIGPKTKFFEADLLDPASCPEAFTANTVFCCLGTTRRQAGSARAFREVDFERVVRCCAFARNAGADTLALVSSIGANAGSGLLYLRTKGETEAAVLAQNWPRIALFRPSLLLGKRLQARPGELVGAALFGAFTPLFIGPWKKYRSIRAADVAEALLHWASYPENPSGIWESDRIQALADDKR